MSKPSIAAKIVMISRCIPPKPPCFHSSNMWLQYVIQAESAHKESDAPGRGPFAPGVEGFNPNFDFCLDCISAKEKAAKGLCNPAAIRGGQPAIQQTHAVVKHKAMSSLKSMWMLIAHADDKSKVSELVCSEKAIQVARRSQKSVIWYCNHLVSHGYLRCTTNKADIQSSVWWDSSCNVPAKCQRPSAKAEKGGVVV